MKDKRCFRCKISKKASLKYFTRDKNRRDGLYPTCKSCKYQSMRIYNSMPHIKERHQKKHQIWYHNIVINNPESLMLNSAKSRANISKLDFNITIDDIIIPKICPILGIKLKKTKNRLSHLSPSIDRINPKLGYIKGNIQIISYKANTMKNNANKTELLKFADWIYKTFKQGVKND